MNNFENAIWKEDVDEVVNKSGGRMGSRGMHQKAVEVSPNIYSTDFW